MNSLVLPFAGLAAITTSFASAQVICSQSADPISIGNGSVACQTMAGDTVENSYIRRFSLMSDCGAAGGFTVGSIQFGVQAATSTTGFHDVNIRVYTIAPMDALTYGNMTLVAERMIQVPDGNQFFVNENFNSPVVIPAGVDVVAEVDVPQAATTPNAFFIGSNGMGQTGVTYLVSQSCGTPEPTDVATLGAGFPNMHVLIELNEATVGGIGMNYCSPNPNSTGGTGSISAFGSETVSDNDVTITASGLPNNAFGFFIVSSMTGFVANPSGSAGNLCLGGAIGRYVGMGEIMNSGNMGTFSLTLDISQTPQPTGFVSIMPGEDWSYQAWHRDSGMTGPTSNFTDGITIGYI